MNIDRILEDGILGDEHESQGPKGQLVPGVNRPKAVQEQRLGVVDGNVLVVAGVDDGRRDHASEARRDVAVRELVAVEVHVGQGLLAVFDAGQHGLEVVGVGFVALVVAEGGQELGELFGVGLLRVAVDSLVVPLLFEDLGNRLEIRVVAARG